MLENTTNITNFIEIFVPPAFRTYLPGIVLIIGILWGFIQFALPQILHYGASGWNWLLLYNVKKQAHGCSGWKAWVPECIGSLVFHAEKQTDFLARSQLYNILDRCKDIKERGETYGLFNQRDEALQIIERIRNKLRCKVKLFPLLDPVAKIQCSDMLLAQNQLQYLFQFELTHLENDPERLEENISENDLIIEINNKLALIDCKDSRSGFIEGCEKIIRQYEPEEDIDTENQPIRIVVTRVPMPIYHYLYGHFRSEKRGKWGIYPENKFWVISIADMQKILENIEELVPNLKDFPKDKIVQQFILRVAQRACINSILPTYLGRDNFGKKIFRLTHSNTIGCLFDYTNILADARYFVKYGYLCESCAEGILNARELEGGHRNDFLHAIQNWLELTRINL